MDTRTLVDTVEEVSSAQAAPASTPGPRTRKIPEWVTGDATVDRFRTQLESPTVIRQRGVLCVDLFSALERDDASWTHDLLNTIPTDCPDLSLYLLPQPHNTHPAALRIKAQQYDDHHQTVQSRLLLRFVDDARTRAMHAQSVDSAYHALPQAQREKTYAPQVRALCLALRDTHELALKHRASELVLLIQAANGPHDPDRLVAEFARQPFAHVGMLVLKCLLLATHTMHRDMVHILLSQLRQAFEQQRTVSQRMQDELCRETFQPEKVAELALVEYAKQMTSAPVDFVSEGALWSQVRAMDARIQAVAGEYQQKGPDFGAQQVALQWVARQIRDTRLPHNLSLPKKSPRQLRSAKDLVTAGPTLQTLPKRKPLASGDQAQLTADLSTIPNEQIERWYAPEVRHLCQSLSGADVPQLTFQADDLAQWITSAMTLVGRDFVTDLAIQPYASLAEMRRTCVQFLSLSHAHGHLVIDLQRKIEEAQKRQREAPALLRSALLQSPFDKEKVASLALLVYAGQMTSAATNGPSANEAPFASTLQALREVLAHYAEDPSGQYRVEQAALDSILNWMRKTHTQPTET
ncbi:hypothetical protein [Hydrogenophaga sp. BPS33]|uniref:hypothetical protein n=1 Tax=Hydrogenophaga sp. BPS33 TaxID=2651974 RepID=UPI00131F5499|nr:hypothetical protein [Hydrogenophaga sp. BPS33]QHE84421.1 hypothetical protein F9K07_05725 [Hydrogenophaga sp. BPS33]